MAKDLWQFIGVTYDNRLITVEEEIDRSFSRSDAERLCKSRNGFKEIRTSSPISYPLKKNNSSIDSYGTAEDGWEAIQGIFWIIVIWIAYASFQAYYLEICFILGSFEGFAFGRYFLKKEETFAYSAVKKILLYSALIFAIGATYGGVFQIFEDQVWYLKFTPIWYLIFRFTLGKWIYEKFFGNWEHNQRLQRELKKLKLKDERKLELENYNTLFYSSILHITNYFESIKGLKKGATAKFFEDKIGKKIEYIEKVKTELDEIIPSQEFWKLIDKNVKFNKKYNINKKSYIELLKFSKICIKKNISFYSGSSPDVLEEWRQDQDKLEKLINKLKKN